MKPFLTPVLPGASDPAGDLVSSLLGGVSDVDAGALRGISIVALTGTTTGHWEYSTDNGASWQAVGSVKSSSVRLLRDTDRIRYVPGAGFVGTATLTFKAWDQTAGAFGTLASTTGTASAAPPAWRPPW